MKCIGTLASLWMVLTMGFVPVASAQQAVLYEIVENLDTTALGFGHRVSYWTAQGTAQRGSPFCPSTLLPAGVGSCVITAFGTDDIDLAKLATSPDNVGTVWANVVAVANDGTIDNPVDAPEIAIYSGQITGTLGILPDASGPLAPELGKHKKALGPALFLLYVTNGKFFPDQYPVVRTSAPSVMPTSGATATFESTFRLPFNVAKNGRASVPQRGRAAYYLGDDGGLIRIDRQNEYSQGFPLLRGEVFFGPQSASQ
jgi:hypothetical protein